MPTASGTTGMIAAATAEPSPTPDAARLIEPSRPAVLVVAGHDKALGVKGEATSEPAGVGLGADRGRRVRSRTCDGSARLHADADAEGAA